MPDIRTIPCRTALTGEGTSLRLNPYVGCTHNCPYCYATYISGYRNITEPWGSWVLVKKDIPNLLQLELTKRRGVHVFMSTTCDIYQPAEEQYRLTRACLEVLQHAVLLDRDLQVFMLTKSDRVLQDLPLLTQFPAGAVEVGFSLTTADDRMAALVEPGAPSPSRRFEAARTLVDNGIPVMLLVSPVLPHVTERELPLLVQRAAALRVRTIEFSHLNYLDRHVGPALEALYRKLGPEALERLAMARREGDGFRREVDEAVGAAKRKFSI